MTTQKTVSPDPGRDQTGTTQAVVAGWQLQRAPVSPTHCGSWGAEQGSPLYRRHRPVRHWEFSLEKGLENPLPWKRLKIMVWCLGTATLARTQLAGTWLEHPGGARETCPVGLAKAAGGSGRGCVARRLRWVRTTDPQDVVVVPESTGDVSTPTWQQQGPAPR